MKTTDLFKINKQASRLNESLSKTFGQKLNLENFDLHQLQDARNKIRTQLSQIKSDSGFNENLENDAYHKAQFMLDTLNAEIMEREEFVAEVTEEDSVEESGLQYYTGVKKHGEKYMKAAAAAGREGASQEELGALKDKLSKAHKGKDKNEGVEEEAPPTAKGERMVKHIKKGYADDGKVTDKEKGIAYATAWKQHNKDESIQTELSTNTLKSYQDKAGKDIVNTMTSGDYMTTDKSTKKVTNRMKGSERANNKIDNKNESINTGEDMRNLREGEIQQASAIVTAKTMVDRVGRWIEELSGMENDTLLQLGDSIRDEMSSELAKTFISTVAPAIQQALQNLKDTRETLATGVRTLTGEEQGAEMLGADPAAAAPDMAAEPDAMNAAAPEMDAADDFGDEFAAADAAAGGAEAAGREQRESIQYQNRLLKVLAG